MQHFRLIRSELKLFLKNYKTFLCAGQDYPIGIHNRKGELYVQSAFTRIRIFLDCGGLYGATHLNPFSLSMSSASGGCVSRVVVSR